MPAAPLRSIRQMLWHIVKDREVRELPDQELLGRFAVQQDETAFHAIVRRHGAMVFDVCRGVLRTEADAEDAFQVTFLVLAKKATAIRKSSSLASWLHGVAYRTSLKARKQAAARQARDGRHEPTPSGQGDELSWREVSAAIHEEVNTLAEQYRGPLVLCYLEGKSQDEAAKQLGLPKGTLKGRLEKGRELLRRRLIRRGFGPAAMLLAAAWPGQMASAGVPASLIASTLQAQQGVVSAAVARLTASVLKGMLVHQATLPCCVLLLAVALGFGSLYLFSGTVVAQAGEQAQKPVEASAPASKQLPIKGGAGETPIRTAAEWRKRRGEILANLQQVMGPLPDPKTRGPVDLRIEEVEEVGPILRKRISLAVGKDERVFGYLLMPKKIEGKTAGVLCPHQTNGPQGSKETAGLVGLENLGQAKHLAERGYVCLSIDHPGFGTNRPFDLAKTGFQSGVMKAIWNNMHAVDALQSLPEVDKNKIGCIGHSLGGHMAMFIAAFDERIGVTVSNCGFTAFPRYNNGNLQRWSTDMMMPRIATHYENDAAKVPFDFPDVVAALAPRPFLAVSPTQDDFSVDGVKDCLKSAQKVYDLLDASDRLASYHPAHAHHFAAGGRKTAYAFLDRWLK